MSTVGLKLGSLVIRTISKPIAVSIAPVSPIVSVYLYHSLLTPRPLKNVIKAQARGHPGFRRLCIRLAQSIHRTDMRLRLGLLRDQATIDRLRATEKAAKMTAKEKTASSAHADTAPKPSSTSTADTHHTTTYVSGGHTYHIRPLSETKAIDRGAAFISEFFLFAVGGSLILFESVRSRRKEVSRQDVVTERLERLEERTRQDETRLQELEDEIWRVKGGKGPRPSWGMDVVPLWEGQEKLPWWKRWVQGLGGQQNKEGDDSSEKDIIREAVVVEAKGRVEDLLSSHSPTSNAATVLAGKGGGEVKIKKGDN